MSQHSGKSSESLGSARAGMIAEDINDIAKNEQESLMKAEGGSSSSASTSAPANGGGGASASSSDSSKPAPASPNKALPAIVFWICMSMAVILFNKFLYTGYFKYPLTLTTIHMGFATLATTALRAAGKLQVPALGWSFNLKNVLPIGVLFAFSLGFSNVAAVKLSVSFIQMIKALTPMITLAIAVGMGMEKASAALVAIVSAMCVGVGIASYGEIEFDSLGVMLQLASISCEAARLVVTQKLLQASLPKGSSPLVSISLFAPWSFLFLLPVAITKEPAAIDALMAGNTGLVVLLNTATAFTLNIAVVILVSQTSGLTLTLAGIVKDIMLIVASIGLFGNPITYVQVAGYSLALYGLNMYHIFRANKGAVPFASLAHEAATDRNMIVMGAGMVALMFFARSG